MSTDTRCELDHKDGKVCQARLVNGMCPRAGDHQASYDATLDPISPFFDFERFIEA